MKKTTIVTFALRCWSTCTFFPEYLLLYLLRINSSMFKKDIYAYKYFMIILPLIIVSKQNNYT